MDASHSVSSVNVSTSHQVAYDPQKEKSLRAICELAEKAVQLGPRGKQEELLTFLKHLSQREHKLENRVQAIQNRFSLITDMAQALVIQALIDKSSKEDFSLALEYFLKSVAWSRDLDEGSGCEPLIYFALVYSANVEIFQAFKDVGCRFDLILPDYENQGDHIFTALQFGASGEVIQFLRECGADKNVCHELSVSLVSNHRISSSDSFIRV